MRTTITTWADGFGTWHARIAQRDPADRMTTDRTVAERLARVAIECELLAREPHLDLAPLKVVEILRANRDGVLSSEWVETWPGDPVPALEIVDGDAS